VALLPRRGASARAAAEAIACGVPAVALAGSAPYAAFLGAQDLRALVAPGAREFVALAGKLLAAPEFGAGILAARPPQADAAARFALAIEQHARHRLSASEAA